MIKGFLYNSALIYFYQ